jgi:hypothetical protein
MCSARRAFFSRSVDRALTEREARGELTREEANAIYDHEVMLRVSELFGYIYEREPWEPATGDER